MKPKIVGISGPIGAGKSSIANILINEKRFNYVSFGNLIRQILKRESKKITRKSLQERGNQVIKQLGYEGITSLLLENIDPEADYVIDGIRHIEIFRFLKQVYGTSFQLVFVDAPVRTRFERVRERAHYDNVDSIQKFKEYENHPLESNIHILEEVASLVIDNTKNKQHMRRTIQKFVRQVFD